ncbi:hypothetical protein AEQU1_01743 [Aequorivita sp. CIP111184]|nr:hypothetical protein AEQU1_01743 [Aequorivita sp. CIP111184]
MFPSLSVTESVTVVLPTGKTVPLAGVAIISPEMLPSSTSKATPVKLTTAPQVPGALFATMSAGQAITGGLPTTGTGKPETLSSNVPVAPPKE